MSEYRLSVSNYSQFMSNINIFSVTTAKKRNGNFPETAMFGSYSMKHDNNMLMIKGLPGPVFVPKKQIMEAEGFWEDK